MIMNGEFKFVFEYSVMTTIIANRIFKYSFWSFVAMYASGMYNNEIIKLL